MRQILQNLKTGETYVAEAPAPEAKPGQLLVRVRASAVSVGTERTLVEFSQSGLLGKARKRPDLLRQAINKARRDGPLAVWEAAQSRLEQAMPLGYSCSGTVEALGAGATGYTIGDRVACAGAGFANHADFVSVPENLCVPLPREGSPSFEEAAFVTLGAIALQGLRLGEPRLGETVAVIGLGLLGQIACQLARASGCRAIGVDLDCERVALGRSLGLRCAERAAAEEAVLAETGGRGADLVLITADASSNDPIELAGVLARDRGTVVAVGAVGMSVPRNLYYRKELVLKISRSYGPGRYDPVYEEAGLDYPVSYVRWTENRNMQEVVRLMSQGALQVSPLITHRFPIESAVRAYELLSGKTQEKPLGITLTYGSEAPRLTKVPGRERSLDKTESGPVGIGVLGAGNFASAVMLPVLQRSGVALRGIASASGTKAKVAADRFGFAFAASREADVVGDAQTGAVVILSRHREHAEQVRLALTAGKHVFVEKPLCMNVEELESLDEAKRKASGRLIAVGFNRRFAPFTRRLKRCFEGVEPLSIQIRVNAGRLPSEHWTLDLVEGGGRLVGEGCHFIDWANFVAGGAPSTAYCRRLGEQPGEQDWALSLGYPDGSAASIVYTSFGASALGKERYEVSGAETTAIIEDFKLLRVVSGTRNRVERAWLRSHKGHTEQWAAFLAAASGAGPEPAPWEEIVGSMKTVFAAQRSLRTGQPVEVQ